MNRKSVDLVCSRATSQSLCVLASCYDERAGFREGKHKTYWLSYDAEANVLSFGQQSPYVANQLISYALESKGKLARHICCLIDHSKCLQILVKQLCTLKGLPSLFDANEQYLEWIVHSSRRKMKTLSIYCSCIQTMYRVQVDPGQFSMLFYMPPSALLPSAICRCERAEFLDLRGVLRDTDPQPQAHRSPGLQGSSSG